MKASFIVVLLLASSAVASDHRTLWLRNAHSGEDLRVRPFGELGVPSYVTWLRIERLFRSRVTGGRRAVSPRLLRVLSQVQRQFGGRRIELHSGYRAPEGRLSSYHQEPAGGRSLPRTHPASEAASSAEPVGAARLTSYHQVGRAADIRIEGVSCRELFEYCRSLESLGCGLYPNGSHVHIDIRSRATIWVDLSGYGDAARYAANPHRFILEHPEAGR